jgi:hypothetical protein
VSLRELIMSETTIEKTAKVKKAKVVVKELPGLVSLPRAGTLLGVSRQRIFQMGLEEGVFDSIRFIAGAGERPAAYVISTDELDRFLRMQAAQSEPAEPELVPVAVS